ncbi:MAG: CpaD family pilus assembly lipoprotein [Geminicoccaceae bacterium]
MTSAQPTLVARHLARCLGAGTLVLVAACATLEPPPQLALPQPQTVQVEYAHRVSFATDRAELSSGEAMRLRRFLTGLPADRRLSARLVGHADRRAAVPYNDALSARRAETVAAMLRSAGIEPASITLVPLGERLAAASPDDPRGLARDRQLEVLVSTADVVLPGCPDWSRDPGYDPRNEPLSNLGCANAYNLGLMVADPADLVAGVPTAPADGVREAEAVLRYRTDKVKQLDPEALQ